MQYDKISAQYKVPEATVKKLHEETLNELSSSLTGEELQTTAIEKLHLRLRERNSPNSELYLGIIVGYDAPRDLANPRNKPSRRSLMVEAFVANPEEAIKTGKVALLETISGGHGELSPSEYKRTMLNRKSVVVETDTIPVEAWKEYIVNVSGKTVVPLDDIKKWGNGSDNISYLKPLPLNKWNTTIEGIVKTEKSYERFTLVWDQTTKPAIPTKVPVEFRAIKKEYKDGILHLKAGKHTEFVPTDKTVGDLNTLVEAGYKRMKINELVDYHNGLKNKFESLVLVKAWVRDINVSVTIPYIKVDDLTMEMDKPVLKVNLHEGIPVDFGYESQVYVLGRTREVEEEYKESQGDVVLWALGVIPIHNTKKIVEPLKEV